MGFWRGTRAVVKSKSPPLTRAVKLDFEVRCECGTALHATFHEEYHHRGVTNLVIVVEPCHLCKEGGAEEDESPSTLWKGD